jgi:hypothetical protein
MGGEGIEKERKKEGERNRDPDGSYTRRHIKDRTFWGLQKDRETKKTEKTHS